MPRRPLLSLAMLLILLLAGGASCPIRQKPAAPMPTPVFNGQPTIEEIVLAVNANSRGVRQLQSQGARVFVQGFPGVTANLAIDRPRRIRFTAETGLTGPLMNLGSNDEVFWFWVKDAPAVYYARHDQFAYSPARNLLPIEPHWVIEALGVVELPPPSGQYEGPYPRGEDRVEIRLREPTPDGEQTRVMIIHPQYGWVLEQHIYDARGRLAASATASDYRYHPADGVSLPREVTVQLPPTQLIPMDLTMRLEVGGWSINALTGEPMQLWSMPEPGGAPLIDLADPNAPLPIPGGSVQPPTAQAPMPQTPGEASNRSVYQASQPRYRGLSPR